MRKPAPKFEITHRIVHDPKALDEALDLWATFLAGHLRRKAAEKAKEGEKPA